jgi:uncharacterized membrane protein
MTPTIIFLVILGVLIGGTLLELQGVLFGALIGFLTGSVIELRSRILKLEQQVKSSEKTSPDETEEPEQKPPVVQYKDGIVVDEDIESEGVEFEPSTFSYKSTPEDEPDAAPSFPGETSSTKGITQPAEIQSNDTLEKRAQKYIKDFFTTGNVVVRIGIIILFFGVAFLLKYVADRNLLPIGLRLFAVGTGAAIMLVIGWRLRLKRMTYAVLIQGGAVGIMYLTVFAAAKVYTVLTLDLAFVMMVVLVTLTGILALSQEARSLAIFGIVGGFLAPILMSTGQGSHVVLFSYYAFLNAGILGLAWYRSWRVLNLVGFGFTFVIGLIWGGKYYQPSYFATIEPFLILFFLFYVAISVLFAHRQPLKLKGYIDGALVFGLPLIAFGLQCALVKDYEYGSAISSIVLSIFYISLGLSLWKRKVEGMYMLAETFIALGVVFFSLSIPLAFDSSWTTGLWGLEGAGLVWIGLRQKRVLVRSFGLILQLGAGVAFIGTVEGPTGDIPIVNSVYMSCLVICTAGIISHYCFEFFKDRLNELETEFHIPLLGWSLLWWFGGNIHEIDTHIATGDKAHIIILFITLSCWLMGWLNRKFKWADMKFPPMGLLPAVVLVSVVSYISGHGDGPWKHPFYGWGFAAWPLFLWVQYQFLWWFEEKWSQNHVSVSHRLSFWFIIFMLSWEASWGMGQIIKDPSIFQFIAWGVVPGFFVFFLYLYGRKISWPIQRFESDYFKEGLIPVIAFIFLWLIAACFNDGDPSPLSYLPILNPLDAAQIFSFLVILKWRKETKDQKIYPLCDLPPRTISYALCAVSFLWLNALIARTIHYWCNVSFTFIGLYDSAQFQMAISIVWTLTALGIMVFATLKAIREVWFAGAVLLGIVVVKLFLIDLDDIGTIARIVTFLVVGILMLVIGYFSPLPPKEKEMVAETEN